MESCRTSTSFDQLEEWIAWSHGFDNDGGRSSTSAAPDEQYNVTPVSRTS